MKYDVFISHSSTDLELSEKICDYLQDQGIKCWIDSRNVTGQYARSIIEGIKQSEIMVLVYSSKANGSAHVENEIDNAFCLGKMIIPFRIEGTPYSDALRYYLNKSHYVDGIPEPLEALEQLCNQIKRNMSEQKRLEEIDDAFKNVAQWVGIDLDLLRKILKLIKDKTDVQTVPDKESFVQQLNDFLQLNSLEDAESEEPIDSIAGHDETVNIEVEYSQTDDVTQEGRYDILQNKEGEILIIINYHEDEPDNPRIICDGDDSALLYRRKDSCVLLDQINKNACEAIMAVEDVLVVEVKDEDVAREYKVPIKKIMSLRSLYN